LKECNKALYSAIKICKNKLLVRILTKKFNKMEFYELNRLYDENLGSMDLSKSVDNYLFLLMPVLISFGCGISIINIVILSKTTTQEILTHAFATSQSYFHSQAICNFVFQVVSSMVFITNYYEKSIMNSFYFLNNKHIYLNLKLVSDKKNLKS
jgi:hypothetical protein